MRRRKGRAHGAAMMVWLFFANLFDPARVATTEQRATDRQGRSRPEDRATGAPPR